MHMFQCWSDENADTVLTEQWELDYQQRNRQDSTRDQAMVWMRPNIYIVECQSIHGQYLVVEEQPGPSEGYWGKIETNQRNPPRSNTVVIVKPRSHWAKKFTSLKRI